jgi:hypothetical protein
MFSTSNPLKNFWPKPPDPRRLETAGTVTLFFDMRVRGGEQYAQAVAACRWGGFFYPISIRR